MSTLLRRLRGALGNTAVWGIGWTALGTTANLLLQLTGVISGPVSLSAALWTGLKIGVGGCIAGAAFSAFIAYAYRERRLHDISWVAFAASAAAVTALSITAFVQGASLLSGSGFVPWRYMNPTLPMFAVFGFTAAALSMRMAQLATVDRPALPHSTMRGSDAQEEQLESAEFRRRTQADRHKELGPPGYHGEARPRPTVGEAPRDLR